MLVHLGSYSARICISPRLSNSSLVFFILDYEVLQGFVGSILIPPQIEHKFLWPPGARANFLHSNVLYNIK